MIKTAKIRNSRNTCKTEKYLKYLTKSEILEILCGSEAGLICLWVRRYVDSDQALPHFGIVTVRNSRNTCQNQKYLKYLQISEILEILKCFPLSANLLINKHIRSITYLFRI